MDDVSMDVNLRACIHWHGYMDVHAHMHTHKHAVTCLHITHEPACALLLAARIVCIPTHVHVQKYARFK